MRAMFSRYQHVYYSTEIRIVYSQVRTINHPHCVYDIENNYKEIMEIVVQYYIRQPQRCVDCAIVIACEFAIIVV